MAGILLIVVIYFAVFYPDYWFYSSRKESYSYVSLRTVGLFSTGILTLTFLNWNNYMAYFNNFLVEISLIIALFAALILITHYLVINGLSLSYQDGQVISYLNSRYVAVKSLEIIFQQFVFLAITLSVVNIVGTTTFAFILLMQIILMMHSPLILSINKNALYASAFALAMMAAPLLFLFVQSGNFFPAVYFHTLLYIIYWAVIGNISN